jgi:hypothetical protein
MNNTNQGRVLYWEGKHGPWFCFARDLEEYARAFLKLFDSVIGLQWLLSAS